MVTYGSKTKKIAITSIILGGILLALSLLSLILFPEHLQSLLSLSAILIFSGTIIYIVIYKQFEKLQEIANEIEKK